MDRRINSSETGRSSQTDKKEGYRPPWRDGGSRRNVSDQFLNSKRTQEEGPHERLQYNKLDKDKLVKISDVLCNLAVKWETRCKEMQSSEASNSAQIYFDAVDVIDDFVYKDPSPEKWNQIVTSDNLAVRAARYILQHNLDPKIAFGLSTGKRLIEENLATQEISQSRDSGQAPSPEIIKLHETDNFDKQIKQISQTVIKKLTAAKTSATSYMCISPAGQHAEDYKSIQENIDIILINCEDHAKHAKTVIEKNKEEKSIQSNISVTKAFRELDRLKNNVKGTRVTDAVNAIKDHLGISKFQN